jgi:hypothetical protein
VPGTGAGEFPRFARERQGFVNREQIDMQIHLRGGLIYGIREQARMVLAGNRILCSLRRRPVMPVTRWNHRGIHMGGRPSVAHHACCHAAERGQNQHYRQYRDTFARCRNHGLSLAECAFNASFATVYCNRIF